MLGIAAIGLMAVSCGKIRDLAGKAKQAAEAGVSALAKSKSAKSSEVAVDPALQALVDQTAAGAVFRKDLPFPEQLQVKEERRLTFDSARIVIKSAIGNQVAAFSGTRFFITRFERAGQHVDLTMESAGFAKPEVDKGESDKAKAAKAREDKAKEDKAKGDKAKSSKSKLEQAKIDQEASAAAAAAAVPDELTSIKELSGCKIGFVHDGKAWKATHSNDFKLAVWGRNLEPHMGVICAEAGVMPPVFWLGKGRLKPGDTVPLSGPALALLLGEAATGTLELKLESFEPCGGHPCGVFSVSGSYRATAVPGPDGEVVGEEVSISSGKLWLSLVYPIVMREQLETVQTLSAGARSGHSIRIQGSVAVAVTRTWKPGTAATK